MQVGGPEQHFQIVVTARGLEKQQAPGAFGRFTRWIKSEDVVFDSATDQGNAIKKIQTYIETIIPNQDKVATFGKLHQLRGLFQTEPPERWMEVCEHIEKKGHNVLKDVILENQEFQDEKDSVTANMKESLSAIKPPFTEDTKKIIKEIVTKAHSALAQKLLENPVEGMTDDARLSVSLRVVEDIFSQEVVPYVDTLMSFEEIQAFRNKVVEGWGEYCAEQSYDPTVFQEISSSFKGKTFEPMRKKSFDSLCSSLQKAVEEPLSKEEFIAKVQEQLDSKEVVALMREYPHPAEELKERFLVQFINTLIPSKMPENVEELKTELATITKYCEPLLEKYTLAEHLRENVHALYDGLIQNATQSLASTIKKKIESDGDVSASQLKGFLTEQIDSLKVADGEIPVPIEVQKQFKQKLAREVFENFYKPHVQEMRRIFTENPNDPQWFNLFTKLEKITDSISFCVKDLNMVDPSIQENKTYFFGILNNFLKDGVAIKADHTFQKTSENEVALTEDQKKYFKKTEVEKRLASFDDSMAVQSTFNRLRVQIGDLSMEESKEKIQKKRLQFLQEGKSVERDFVLDACAISEALIEFYQGKMSGVDHDHLEEMVGRLMTRVCIEYAANQFPASFMNYHKVDDDILFTMGQSAGGQKKDLFKCQFTFDADHDTADVVQTSGCLIQNVTKGQNLGLFSLSSKITMKPTDPKETWVEEISVKQQT